jgi:hypothetical protein
MANQALGACPVCGSPMRVAEYACTGCGITVRGEFEQSELCNLPADLLHFVRVFLCAEGSLKQVERELGISYPTVKARLARVNQILAVPAFSDMVETQKRVRLLKEFSEGRLTKEQLLENL